MENLRNIDKFDILNINPYKYKEVVNPLKFMENIQLKNCKIGMLFNEENTLSHRIFIENELPTNFNENILNNKWYYNELSEQSVNTIDFKHTLNIK